MYTSQCHKHLQDQTLQAITNLQAEIKKVLRTRNQNKGGDLNCLQSNRSGKI